jgi:hypothetical protein
MESKRPVAATQPEVVVAEPQGGPVALQLRERLEEQAARREPQASQPRGLPLPGAQVAVVQPMPQPALIAPELPA